VSNATDGGRRLLARTRYSVATALHRPTAKVLDSYFRAFPDAYHMEGNTDSRLAALAAALRAHVGPFESLLDVSCHEGLVLSALAREFGVADAMGLDISTVALARARERCAAELPAARFAPFDLNALYAGRAAGLPVERPYDVIIVCEVLYHIGPFANTLWSHAGLARGRKRRLLAALQAQAGKAVVIQHFGRRQRDAIGSVARSCGAVEADARWGIFILEGKAGR
jgi:SAM-dependent methyltransferase